MYQKPNGGDIRIPASVVITEILDHRSYHATLPNGKVIFIHEPGPEALTQRSVGDVLTVALSLCDFSTGAIVDESSRLVQI